MASKTINTLGTPNTTMTNPNRTVFNILPENKEHLQIFMAKKGFNLREQSEAINELLKKALAAEGY